MGVVCGKRLTFIYTSPYEHVQGIGYVLQKKDIHD